jgi:maltose/moltooligosaccharide transporter
MSTTPTSEKPTLSFGQIWNMCFGFLGIQFGWGLQMANMSSIFEKLGATQIAMLWLAAPLTGLLVQPIIGYLSDRTWHPKFGRRRPFFLVGAILSSIALILMPNSSAVWMAAGLLWILDASINISMEPFRAFVADKLPQQQRTLGYTTQSFFIGLGAVLASAMPFVLTNWLGVENEADAGEIATSVKWSFYIGAAAFFGAVLYTILTTKEYPPTAAEKEALAKESGKGFMHGVKEIFSSISGMPKIMRQLAPVQFFTWIGLFCMWIFFGVTISRSVFGYKDTTAEQNIPFNAVQTSAMAIMSKVYKEGSAEYKKAKKELNKYFNGSVKEFPSFAGITLDSIVKATPALLNDVSFKENFKSIDGELQAYSESKKQSISFNTVFAPYAASTVAAKKSIDEYRDNLKKSSDGGEWGGNCFAFYSIITFAFAFALPKLASRIGKRRTHFLCLILGGLGLLSIGFITSKYALLVSMTGVGIAWASILSMPYAMLSNRLPAEKMGIYMGIFNFFIVIPEIISALSFDFVLESFFGMNRALFMATGGVLMLIAAFFCLRVTESD